jgi:hypothetical protein
VVDAAGRRPATGEEEQSVDIEILKPTLWSQFGASIDMLEGSIRSCPEQVWTASVGKRPFWAVVFHTLFFLDLYLSESEQGFRPPPPFDQSVLPESGRIPGRAYTRTELQGYLDFCRDKCITSLSSLTEESALQRCGIARLNMAVIELHLYNMRHVQHHAAQLSHVLLQDSGAGTEWVRKSRS